MTAWTLDGETAPCVALWLLGPDDSYTRAPTRLTTSVATVIANSSIAQHCVGYVYSQLAGGIPLYQRGTEFLSNLSGPDSTLLGYLSPVQLEGMEPATDLQRLAFMPGPESTGCYFKLPPLQGYYWPTVPQPDAFGMREYSVSLGGITTKLGLSGRGNFVTTWKTITANVSETSWMSRADLGRGLGVAEFWALDDSSEYYNPTMAGQYPNLALTLPLKALRPAITIQTAWRDRGDGTATLICENIPVEFIVDDPNETSKVFYRCRQGWRLDLNHLGIPGAHRLTVSYLRKEAFPNAPASRIWSTQLSVGLFLRDIFDVARLYDCTSKVYADYGSWNGATSVSCHESRSALTEYDTSVSPAEVLNSGASRLTSDFGAMVLRDSGDSYGPGSDLSIALLGSVRRTADSARRPMEMHLTNYRTGGPGTDIDSAQVQSIGFNSLGFGKRADGRILWQFWILTADYADMASKIDQVIAKDALALSPMEEGFQWSDPDARF